jgi:hypothetical protein
MIVKEYKYADWFILFGNGDLVHFEAYNEYQKDNGEFWVQFFMTATSELVDKYELKADVEINQYNMIEMHYAKVYVHYLIVNSEITRVVIDLDLLGNQTPYSLENMALKERIRQYERQLRILNIHNYQTTKEMGNVLNRQEENIKRQKRIFDLLKDKKEPTSFQQPPPEYASR